METNYYDVIADGYDELHKEEQLKKLKIIKNENFIRSDDVLLDVGCGTGFSLDYFEVKKAIGIEPSKNLLKKYSGKFEILNYSAENIPFKDSEFDVVISITAIQNFTDVRKGLEEIKRVGKERFVLTFLKRLEKSSDLEFVLREVFSDFKIRCIEEEKDFIFIVFS